MADNDITEEEILTRGTHAVDLFNAPFFKYIGDYITHDLLQKIVQLGPEEDKLLKELWTGIYGVRLFQEALFALVTDAQNLRELKRRQAEDEDDDPGDN